MFHKLIRNCNLEDSLSKELEFPSILQSLQILENLQESNS